MKLIKLTDEHGQTHNHTQWGKGITHRIEWRGQFCSAGCIHVYQDLYVGLFLNPIHAMFNPVRAWEAESDVLLSDNGLKFGVASLTINKEIIPLPVITGIQRVAFGIYSALEVSNNDRFVKWANNWLSGKDRSSASATTFAKDAKAAYAAYNAYNAYAAANAVNATANAADAAVNAADTAIDATIDDYHAAKADYHAAYAAYAAAKVTTSIIEFAIIAQKSMEVI